MLWLWYVYNVLSLNLNILSYHLRLPLSQLVLCAGHALSVSLHTQQCLPLRNPPWAANMDPMY